MICSADSLFTSAYSNVKHFIEDKHDLQTTFAHIDKKMLGVCKANTIGSKGIRAELLWNFVQSNLPNEEKRTEFEAKAKR